MKKYRLNGLVILQFIYFITIITLTSLRIYFKKSIFLSVFYHLSIHFISIISFMNIFLLILLVVLNNLATIRHYRTVIFTKNNYKKLIKYTPIIVLVAAFGALFYINYYQQVKMINDLSEFFFNFYWIKIGGAFFEKTNAYTLDLFKAFTFFIWIIISWNIFKQVLTVVFKKLTQLPNDVCLQMVNKTDNLDDNEKVIQFLVFINFDWAILVFFKENKSIERVVENNKREVYAKTQQLVNPPVSPLY